MRNIRFLAFSWLASPTHYRSLWNGQDESQYHKISWFLTRSIEFVYELKFYPYVKQHHHFSILSLTIAQSFRLWLLFVREETVESRRQRAETWVKLRQSASRGRTLARVRRTIWRMMHGLYRRMGSVWAHMAEQEGSTRTMNILNLLTAYEYDENRVWIHAGENGNV